MYVVNDQIDLYRDVGTVTGFEGILNHPVVAFDDGFCTPVNPDELKPFVGKTSPQKPMHLYFGCSENPCRWPGHS